MPRVHGAAVMLRTSAEARRRFPAASCDWSHGSHAALLPSHREARVETPPSAGQWVTRTRWMGHTTNRYYKRVQVELSNVISR